MTRRVWIRGVGACTVAVLAAGVVVASRPGAAPAQAPAANATSLPTARVERGDLASAVTLNGTLAYAARADGSPYPAVNRASGTYTHLPEPGDRIACGRELYRVNERPVLLLCGAVPLYRELRIGNRGADVRALNGALHARGTDRREGVRISPRASAFTRQTQAALRRLQRAQGAALTGELKPGDAVVLPTAVRIATVRGELGGVARPGARVLDATSGALGVRVQLDPADRELVRAGDRAQLTLAGSRAARGTVRRLGTVTTPDEQGAAPTIPVFVALDNPAHAAGLAGAPVKVAITTQGVSDALSVPLTALVGRAAGGSAVERVRPGGGRELVAVELGLVDASAGRVQVTGRIAAGDAVVVPAS